MRLSEHDSQRTRRTATACGPDGRRLGLDLQLCKCVKTCNYTGRRRRTDRGTARGGRTGGVRKHKNKPLMGRHRGDFAANGGNVFASANQFTESGRMPAVPYATRHRDQAHVLFSFLLIYS